MTGASADSDEYRKMVDESVETLFSYTLKPFVHDFLARQPPPRIPTYLNEGRMRDEVTAALLGTHQNSRIRLEDLVAYLDRLQESGRLHVFLLSVPRDQIRRLSEAEEVKRRLAGKGVADRYSQNHFIFHAREVPELSAVRHDPGRLVLKWVETRTWWKVRERDLDLEAGVQTVKSDQKEERSVSFFCLDLESGDAEVKIQKLRYDALTTRRRAFEQYRGLAVELLGCDALEQILLAPAIRRALGEGVLISKAEAVLPDGSIWKGKPGGSLPVPHDSLRAAISLEYRHEHKIRVGLDARVDEVQIHTSCQPDSLQAVLSQVRQWHADAVANAPLPAFDGPDDRERDGHGKRQEEKWHEQVGRLLRDALSRKRSSGQDVPDQDSDRDRILAAVREYVLSHPAEADASKNQAPTEPEGTPQERASGPWHSQVAIEQFLRYIKRVADNTLRIDRQEIQRLQRNEQMVFGLFITAALVGVGIVIAAVILTLAGQVQLTIGIFSGLLGLLTNYVSVLLRNSSEPLERKRTRIEARNAETERVLQAIQAALAVGDLPAMRQVAEMLRDRALR